MGVIRVSGTLACPPGEAEALRAALPAHIRLSRAEPGCLSFDVTETAPCVFTLDESFADRAAFDAHQARTRASVWWRITAHLPRDFTVIEA
jgi:quinol monooxygenase YgiN